MLATVERPAPEKLPTTSSAPQRAASELAPVAPPAAAGFGPAGVFGRPALLHARPLY
jgi:hypothetical protein